MMIDVPQREELHANVYVQSQRAMGRRGLSVQYQWEVQGLGTLARIAGLWRALPKLLEDPRNQQHL
jgi:hypothetical protein